MDDSCVFGQDSRRTRGWFDLAGGKCQKMIANGIDNTIYYHTNGEFMYVGLFFLYKREASSR